ncbi:Beta-galactosidase 4 [Platanthera zijinensis]|uniref:Beta-galactosidase 4 n=1 Tax=Platanthera zijinensis TaxID=2320716 RepID=A0AAP0BZC7_9ASPA
MRIKGIQKEVALTSDPSAQERDNKGSCSVKVAVGVGVAAFRPTAKPYVNWAASMAASLETGVPWVMCQQDDAPDPIDGICPICMEEKDLSDQELQPYICGYKLYVDLQDAGRSMHVATSPISSSSC